MHSNISYPGLKAFIITDSFMKDGVFHFHMGGGKEATSLSILQYVNESDS